jgi:hypothetical protein
MNTKAFNLALMVFWLMICIGLLTRDYWMPADLNEKVTGPQTPLVIGIAAMLALWNLMRLWVAHRFAIKPNAALSPEAEEYRRRIRARLGEDPRVTDPQFKFDEEK